MSRRALESIKVAEFGAYAAGPAVGKVLANLGAQVVHVESRARPDGFRLQYPPFKDHVPGLNRSGCFAMFNDSKYAITLNLQKPEGPDLARRLVNWADVVIENMRPGVMARLRLAYEESRTSNPGLVMLSSCNMGQSGPRAFQPGFGSQLSALAGFCGLTGYADGLPMILYGPYIDFIAVAFGATSVLAALVRRQRTGEGCFIDLAQYECGLHFLAGPMLDYATSGAVAARRGNDEPGAAPHGAYRCRDGWLAISCWSNDEFGRLARAVGRPGWPEDPAVATLEDRRKNRSLIDTIVASWASERGVSEAAESLQASSVHASPVNNVKDLFEDPQLLQRGVWQTRRHEEMGDHAYRKPSFLLSRTPAEITTPAPVVGSDNDFVYRKLLGLDAATYDRYVELGVID